MAIKGVLSEFSLAELFKVLEEGNKTGRLVLTPKDNSNSEMAAEYYIWFRQGRIVGAADRNDNLGLTTLISQRRWLSPLIVGTLAERCPIDTPLGICLKSKNLIQAEHLKMLFYVQVMQQVCKLFQLSDAYFEFETRNLLPMAEMTGLSSPGTEITLVGLRALKDWSMLQEKLPDITSALIATRQEQPHLSLNLVESQVWQHCNGKTSLKSIAEQTQLPISQVQQIAFRLISVNLAEELPMVALSATKNDQQPLASGVDLSLEKEKTVSIAPSKTLLKNLISFLQKNT